MFFVSQYLIVDIFLLMVSNQTDFVIHTHSLLPVSLWTVLFVLYYMNCYES